GFKHADLLRWIDANRARLLVAALTILRAYCRAGRPTQNLGSFGSFGGWSGLVRSAVVWLGLPDPCKTQLKLAEVGDTTADILLQLFNAWRQLDPNGEGFVLSELVKRLYEGQLGPPTDEAAVAMRAAVENLVGSGSGKRPTARQI